MRNATGQSTGRRVIAVFSLKGCAFFSLKGWYSQAQGEALGESAPHRQAL
jgi:hypothetical protein